MAAVNIRQSTATPTPSPATDAPDITANDARCHILRDGASEADKWHDSRFAKSQMPQPLLDASPFLPFPYTLFPSPALPSYVLLLLPLLRPLLSPFTAFPLLHQSPYSPFLQPSPTPHLHPLLHPSPTLPPPPPPIPQHHTCAGRPLSLVMHMMLNTSRRFFH